MSSPISLPQTLRAGIIGSGGQAQRHVETYKQSGYELVAISDVAQKNLDAFQAEHGGKRTYLDYQKKP